jgi:calcineurin-like phosphoesterase family protein
MVKKIRGYKVLIAGNHEACASSWDGIVDEYYAGILTIGPHLVLSHEPIEFPYGYLLHGHDHNPPQFHYGRCNVCADVISYTPLNLNQFVKSGKLKECDDVHRATIDGATARKQKRLQRGRAKTYIPPELLKEVAAACSH